MNGSPRFLAMLALLAAGILSVATTTAHEEHEHSAPTAKAVPRGHDMSARWAAQQQQRAPIGVSVAMDERGLLWLARVADGHLRISRSGDGGKSFGAEVIVNPEPEAIRAEGQSRPVVIARNGVIAVAWARTFSKVFSGDVRFARSVDDGRSFSAPRTINNDDNPDIGHGFTMLAAGPEGQLAIAWLDSRHRAAATATQPYAGSSLYLVRSTDGGASFSPNQKFADHSCECCRVAMTLDAKGNPVLLWRQLYDEGVRDFALLRVDIDKAPRRASEDDWRIEGCPHHGGDVAIDGRDGVHLVWFTGNPQKAGLYYRRFDGNDASTPIPFGDPDAQAGHPVVHARDEGVVIAWREFDGQRYRLMSMSSRDRGARWTPPNAIAHADGVADLPLFIAGAPRPLLAWNTSAGLKILSPEDAP